MEREVSERLIFYFADEMHGMAMCIRTPTQECTEYQTEVAKALFYGEKAYAKEKAHHSQ